MIELRNRLNTRFFFSFFLGIAFGCCLTFTLFRGPVIYDYTKLLGLRTVDDRINKFNEGHDHAYNPQYRNHAHHQRHDPNRIHAGSAHDPHDHADLEGAKGPDKVVAFNDSHSHEGETAEADRHFKKYRWRFRRGNGEEEVEQEEEEKRQRDGKRAREKQRQTTVQLPFKSNISIFFQLNFDHHDNEIDVQGPLLDHDRTPEPRDQGKTREGDVGQKMQQIDLHVVESRRKTGSCRFRRRQGGQEQSMGEDQGESETLYRRQTDISQAGIRELHTTMFFFTKAAFKYVHANHRNEYDYVLKVRGEGEGGQHSH